MSRRWEQAPPHDTDYGGGTGGHGRRWRPSPAWIRRWLPSPAPIRWRRPSPAWIRRPVPSPTLIRCLLTVTGGGRRRRWLRRLKDDGDDWRMRTMAAATGGRRRTGSGCIFRLLEFLFFSRFFLFACSCTGRISRPKLHLKT